MVEAKKRAFVDRERLGGDPRHVDLLLDVILSDDQADRAAAEIDLHRAATPDLPTFSAQGDTTYFCVVDQDGNGVSAIQSLNLAFGSGVLAGDTGILMNNRMAYWHLEPGHPNLLVPGKRVRHTMNAPMILRDGKLWCVFGTPGADNQVQINFQVAVAMLDFGFDPQEAVEAPRWSSNQPGQDSNYPHAGEFALTLEDRFPRDVSADLERRGHRVLRVGDLDGPCNVEAIRVLDNGVRMAGSDPRRDGWALAY
jgi:gamma-glutamyltranspeptidase